MRTNTWPALGTGIETVSTRKFSRLARGVAGRDASTTWIACWVAIVFSGTVTPGVGLELNGVQKIHSAPKHDFVQVPAYSCVRVARHTFRTGASLRHYLAFVELAKTRLRQAGVSLE
jgi:hypothetical protein